MELNYLVITISILNQVALLYLIPWLIQLETILPQVYIPLLSINPFKAIAGIRYDSNNQKWSSELISTYTGVAISSSNTNFVLSSYYF